MDNLLLEVFWGRGKKPTDLGLDPLIARIERLLGARKPVSLVGQLDSHKFILRTRGKTIRIVLVGEKDVTYCFQEELGHLLSVLKVTSDGRLYQALCLTGQRAMVQGCLPEAYAREWIGV